MEYRQEGELEPASCQTDFCVGGADREYSSVPGGSIHSIDTGVNATLCCAVQHGGEMKYLTTLHQWADEDCLLEEPSPREAYQKCRSSNSSDSERKLGKLSDYNKEPDWSVIESTPDRCPEYSKDILYKDYDPWAGPYWSTAEYDGIAINYFLLWDNGEEVVKIGAASNEYKQSSIRDWNVVHNASCSSYAPSVQLETESIAGDSGGPYYTTDGRKPSEIVGMNLGSLSGSNRAVGVESEILYDDGINFYGTNLP